VRFTAFGGVPQHVLFDQMKSVIVADHRPGGGRLLENDELPALRRALGLSHSRVSAVSRADERESRAPDSLLA